MTYQSYVLDSQNYMPLKQEDAMVYVSKMAP
jgi:hypothetical protein